MSIYGISGYPFIETIPHGKVFVDFMQSRYSSPPSSTPSAPGSTMNGSTSGGFSDDVTAVTLSTDKIEVSDGTTRLETQRSLSDGSMSSGTRFKYADGTLSVLNERHSMPDADGYERVRVREAAIDADGTRHIDRNVFRVPTGMSLDWDSKSAQQYFLHSASKSLPPGIEWSDIPNFIPPETTADTSELKQDTNPAASAAKRPTIPLAT